MNRRGVARRVFAANRLGVPSVIAGMSHLMSASADSLIPHLLVATGDVLLNLNAEQVLAFTTWAARPLIAEVLARVWARKFGAADEATIIARMFGELVGISNARCRVSIDDLHASRNQIVLTLRRSPPSINEVRSLIHEILLRCRSAGDNIYTADQCRDVIHPAIELTAQTYAFYEMRGHVIPADIFANEAFRVIWVQLQDPAIEYVDTEGADYEISEEFSHIWANANQNFILGYYEGKAIQSPEKSRSIIGGSIFTYLTSLAKNSGVTPSWVQRRRRMFADRLPGINFDTYITEHTIRHYQRLYGKEDATWEEVYKQLATCWSMLQIPEGIPLTWIIEQASNNHVTCLTTIADVVTKLKFFDSDMLIGQGIPVGNFEAALTQVRDLMRNPFCSVVRPTVQLRQYADLAYLCAYIKRELLRDEAFVGYRGSPATSCTLSAQELQTIARSIHQITVRKQSAGVDLVSLYSNTLQADHQVKEINGEVFVIPIRENPVNHDDGEAGPHGHHDHHAGEVPYPINNARAGWPPAAMNLPAGTRKVTDASMFDAITEAMSPRARAFTALMHRMYALQVQVPLTAIPENSVTVPSPLRSIPVAVRDQLNVWGIGVPQEWGGDEPRYDPAPDAEHTVREEFIVVVPRPAVIYLPADEEGARAEGDDQQGE